MITAQKVFTHFNHQQVFNRSDLARYNLDSRLKSIQMSDTPTLSICVVQLKCWLKPRVPYECRPPWQWVAECHCSPIQGWGNGTGPHPGPGWELRSQTKGKRMSLPPFYPYKYCTVVHRLRCAKINSDIYFPSKLQISAYSNVLIVN